MFGVSAGAVSVYLAGDRFPREQAPDALRWSTTWFAVSVPITHLAALVVPIPLEPSVVAIAAVTFSTVLLAVPFFFSGIAIALALTRIPGNIGRIYATDLVSAASAACW